MNTFGNKMVDVVMKAWAVLGTITGVLAMFFILADMEALSVFFGITFMAMLFAAGAAIGIAIGLDKFEDKVAAKLANEKR